MRHPACRQIRAGTASYVRPAEQSGVALVLPTDIDLLPLPPLTIITTIFPVFESEPQRGVTPRFRHASMNTGCSCNKGSEDEMHVPCLQQHVSRLLPRYCFTDTNFISYLSVNEVCNACHQSVTEGKVCNTRHLFVTEISL